MASGLGLGWNDFSGEWVECFASITPRSSSAERGRDDEADDCWNCRLLDGRDSGDRWCGSAGYPAGRKVQGHQAGRSGTGLPAPRLEWPSCDAFRITWQGRLAEFLGHLVRL